MVPLQIDSTSDVVFSTLNAGIDNLVWFWEASQAQKGRPRAFEPLSLIPIHPVVGKIQNVILKLWEFATKLSSLKSFHCTESHSQDLLLSKQIIHKINSQLILNLGPRYGYGFLGLVVLNFVF